MADPQKTEQPTRRRLDKARADGSFPVSRDVLPAVQLLLFAFIAASGFGAFVQGTSQCFRFLTGLAFRPRLGPNELSASASMVIEQMGLPLGKAAVAIFGAMFAAQLAMTRLGFALSKLSPDLKRLNPVQRISQLPSQGLEHALHALLLLPLLGGITWYLAAGSLDRVMALPFAGIAAGSLDAVGSVESVFRKVAFLIAIFAAVSYWHQYRKWMGQLRMSKQEIRDEHKESEGNPQVKAKIRQLRRSMLRRRMMSEVDKATAVVVNPTHFAVAIRYVPAEMRAPKVVAKGKNYLALRIRERAIRNQVPIVENPPLAQALYRTAEVGQEIPAELYRAVAEVLAYIFRLLHGQRFATS